MTKAGVLFNFSGTTRYCSRTNEMRFSAASLLPGQSPSLFKPVWKSKFYGAFVLNHRVVLHAIDATPVRWRDFHAAPRQSGTIFESAYSGAAGVFDSG